MFESQEALAAALKAGIDGDFIAVVRGQGPRANGMPELHKLIPALSGLLARGRRVAIVTDGRMSGASGKVPSAIHLTPEAAAMVRSRGCATATSSGSMPCRRARGAGGCRHAGGA